MKRFKLAGKKIEIEESDLNFVRVHRRPGGWQIAETADGQRIRFFARRSKNQFWIKVGMHQHFGEQIPVVRGSSNSDVKADLTAQFPGKVRKCLVSNGAQVVQGTPLVMVEAMKMEFAIKAPADGTVKQILVQEGQTLTPGQLLVDFAVKEVNQKSGAS